MEHTPSGACDADDWNVGDDPGAMRCWAKQRTPWDGDRLQPVRQRNEPVSVSSTPEHDHGEQKVRVSAALGGSDARTGSAGSTRSQANGWSWETLADGLPVAAVRLVA